MKKQHQPLPPARYLAEMAAFAKVVQTKSFSKAASTLGVTRSAVSKHIARLEDALRVRLLNRTTRALSLTEAGAAVFEHCERMLTEAEDAATVVHRLSAAPRGTVRVSTTNAYGRLQIVPLLPEFFARYPEVSVQLLFTDRFVDLPEEGFDVVVRLSDKLSPNLVMKRLAPIDYVVCASPKYFKEAGVPRVPADLATHNCLQFSTVQQTWQFDGPKGRVAVNVQGKLQVNNSEALRDMLLEHIGIALLPTWAVSEDLKRGRLVAALTQYRAIGPFGTDVHIGYLPSRYPSPKIRAFVDFLSEKLRASRP
jgi:DNA-binding transcriptional LysR family regulator